jgi:hypothetical protein
MRILPISVAIVLAAAASACGSDSTSRPTATAKLASTPPIATVTTGVTPAARATTGVTPAATQPRAGETLEVTGIVGGLNLNGNVIEIKRLQGADVTQIAVDPATVIRKSTGGRLQLKDVRTSDRIIASGVLNDRRDTLVASEITVQDVVPGAQPGG